MSRGFFRFLNTLSLQKLSEISHSVEIEIHIGWEKDHDLLISVKKRLL